jgi:hypothetical protein
MRVFRGLVQHIEIFLFYTSLSLLSVHVCGTEKVVTTKPILLLCKISLFPNKVIRVNAAFQKQVLFRCKQEWKWKMDVSWDVATCILLFSVPRFKGLFCLCHHVGEKIHPDYKKLRLRRQPSSYSSPWEPQTQPRGWAVNTPTSYSGAPVFRSRSCLRFFVIFLSSSRQMPV